MIMRQRSAMIAVLIVSCDKYSDLWDPFLRAFDRYWPDCPFTVSLLSSHIHLERRGIKKLVRES